MPVDDVGLALTLSQEDWYVQSKGIKIDSDLCVNLLLLQEDFCPVHHFMIWHVSVLVRFFLRYHCNELFGFLFPSVACLLTSRLRLHEGKVIKDRRHHLRTYPNCFVAKELIDWLIEHKEATERDTAIKIMQNLLDQSIIHHGKAALRSFVH